MSPMHRPSIVVLGLMSVKPVAGVVWQTLHYLIGFQRLGFDVYYIEAHGRAPIMLMQAGDPDGSAKAAALIADVLGRFDLGHQWAFHALHADGACYGLSKGELERVYRSAALIINLHGATLPRPEHTASGRLIYLETDPVALQIEMANGREDTRAFLNQHHAFFTFAENYGRPGCTLPASSEFSFKPTRQPVVPELWQGQVTRGDLFTTVGSWKQLGRDVSLNNDLYTWSKHLEFAKFINLPSRTSQKFELALSKCDETDKRLLESNGWMVRDALSFSTDMDAYRAYILQSKGEFTVAKDQNVRMRSGWFSDRSATYLAAGKPVITQETGFSSILPTGSGLFAFTSLEDILEALEEIDSNYEQQSRQASVLAESYFGYDIVLPRLLDDLGISPIIRSPSAPQHSPTQGESRPLALSCAVEFEQVPPVIDPLTPLPHSLNIMPIGRRPTRLSQATVESVAARPIPVGLSPYDVVCLPDYASNSPAISIDSIVHEYVQRGHRVFRLAMNAMSRPTADQVESSLINTSQDATGWIDAALTRLRTMHDIETAAVFVPPGRWQSQALAVRERWGWKIVCQLTDPEESQGGKTKPVTGPPGQGCDAVVSPGQDQWSHIDGVIRETFPRMSIVVVTFNQLVFTRLCLETLLTQTEYPNYEVIVVDNASSDGTVDYLHELARWYPQLQVVVNTVNQGFAAASNQGLRVSTGEFLVLLNNDTMVSRGWLTRLSRYLRNQGVGLVGPVTNRIGNEAQIAVPYRTYGEFVAFARDYCSVHEDERFDIRMSAMFCTALRRDVWTRVGPLDERFEIGMLEDDDYSVRVRAAGYRVVCAEDIFVHHFGQASFGDLIPTGEYHRIYTENLRRYEDKWGVPWTPYQLRAGSDYRELVERCGEWADIVIPPGATVAVISKGDEALLQLGGRTAWHFPRGAGGGYAGHYPADSAGAIAHLEEVRAAGATFLLLPRTAFWWLEHYAGFAQHLAKEHRLVTRQTHLCLIYELLGPQEY